MGKSEMREWMWRSLGLSVGRGSFTHWLTDWLGASRQAGKQRLLVYCLQFHAHQNKGGPTDWAASDWPHRAAIELCAEPTKVLTDGLT